jgi:hypothetical protein
MSEITFSKLLDSAVSTNIVSLDNEFNVPKERVTRLELTFSENEKITCDIDYANLVNLNYKLKSASNQIEEYIKTLSLK